MPALWAQLYDIRDGKYVERLGSDGILILDGRYSQSKALAIASLIAAHRKAAYIRLFSGRFSDATPLGPFHPIQHGAH